MEAYRYKNGRKNQYRRWVWNRICDRLAIHGKSPFDSVVLYLAGEGDLDRPEALRRGFRFDNLIAVDSQMDVIKSLRDRGVLAIHGDIADVALAMRDLVDVVYADYCCGITNKSILLAYRTLLMRPRTVVAVNLMRGRDLIGPDVSCAMKEIKHRGAAFGFAVDVAVDQMISGGISKAGDSRELWLAAHPPAVYSYHSKRLVFDSVVFEAFCWIGSDMYNIYRQFDDMRYRYSPRGLKGSIAAILAHRTRRLCE